MSSSFHLKKHHWTDFLRVCAVCHSSFPPIQWLCSHCLNKLKSFYLPPPYMERLESSFIHFRLIDWSYKNDSFIRKLLSSLKGFKRVSFFKFLARDFYSRIQHYNSLKKSIVFIPCPPHLPSKILGFKVTPPEEKDHSYYWGEALSYWSGYPLIPLLKRSQYQPSQKRKTILERKKISFELDPLKPFPKNKTFIFTDDVVTSGATSKSIYSILGRPNFFSVWSIFWRKFETKYDIHSKMN